ncbi:protein of unknown function DUF11 [Actinobacteria bacterium OK074]|nr:protein of unknown function DUF11 [Actinobacteria bacterium OK074]
MSRRPRDGETRLPHNPRERHQRRSQPAPAAARTPRALSFPVHETFDSSTGLGTATGSAVFADGGWLRLTDNSTSRSGAWEMNDAFSSSLGIVAEFTYATWGGTAYDGKRGDGLSFFLADGTARNGTGPSGGPLGYACGGSGGRCTSDGVPGAFVGIGFDEFGNFLSSNVGNGGPGATPNRVTVRGGGNGTTGYRYATAVAGPGGTVETGDRAHFRTVRIEVLPRGGKLLVSVASDSGPGTAMQQLISGYDIGTITNQPALPATLKVGFSGGTGGATNHHEIGDLKINVPANLSITKSVDRTTAVAGEKVVYTLDVKNDDTNAVTSAAVRDTLPNLTDVTWTCAGLAGGTCRQASGTGNPVDTLADLARNGAVRYTVTGTAPAEPTTLTNTATVTAPADRTDTTPADNSATVSSTVTAAADVSAAKTALGTVPVAPGQEYDYRITATDNGPSAAANVTATDTLPTGLTFVSSPDGCTATGQKVTCGPRATLAAGASVAWTFHVKLDPAYTGDGTGLRNTATVATTTPDPNPANNTSAVALPPGGRVQASADVEFSKTSKG